MSTNNDFGIYLLRTKEKLPINLINRKIEYNLAELRKGRCLTHAQMASTISSNYEERSYQNIEWGKYPKFKHAFVQLEIIAGHIKFDYPENSISFIESFNIFAIQHEVRSYQYQSRQEITDRYQQSKNNFIESPVKEFLRARTEEEFIEIYKLIDVSEATLKDWRKGRLPPYWIHIFKFCHLLNCQRHELFKQKNNFDETTLNDSQIQEELKDKGNNY